MLITETPSPLHIKTVWDETFQVTSYIVADDAGLPKFQSFDQGEAEAKMAELTANRAARAAKVAAYGDRLRCERPRWGSRARARFIVLDADDQIIGEYAHLDDVPELVAEAAETAEVAEAAETAEVAESAQARGTITEAQVSTIWAAVSDGVECWMSGPRDLPGIYALDRAEASRYISALHGDS